MKKSKKFYVAYGSNLHQGQMQYRCPDATVYGTGVVKNYSLTFWGNARGCGVATILPVRRQTSRLPSGKSPHLMKETWTTMEGYPHLYRKENIEVAMDDGTTLTGIIYLMNQGIATEPNSYYYSTIVHGYQDFGFDLASLRMPVKKFIWKHLHSGSIASKNLYDKLLP